VRSDGWQRQYTDTIKVLTKIRKLMKSVSETAFKNNLDAILDRVNNDHIPIQIDRQNGRPVVVLSLEDYRSYEETAYLMASPQNAQRLNAAIEQLRTGKGKERELIEE
jgi:antitoxin YefM